MSQVAIWEEQYSKGLNNRYPFDIVVSFVYRNAPSDRSRSDVSILEVGCGTGNNLWFAAREGFNVSGIDHSSHAVERARSRFAAEGLNADLRVGDFTQIPFDSEKFDLVFDRGALTCAGLESGRTAIKEIHRVLKKSGRFFFNPYSDRHSCFVAGTHSADGLTVDLQKGNLAGIGQLCFYGKRDVLNALQPGWKLISLEHLELSNEVDFDYTVHAEWRVVAEKL